jgi:hypothetical protein
MRRRSSPNRPHFQLALLDNEPEAETYQRGAWQEDGRNEEQNLSPVQL